MTATAPTLPDLLTPEETARLLRLSTKSLANDRCNGRGLAYVKLRGRIRYRRADVMQFIESATVRHGDGEAA
ncbi:helix-turn-helix domain-containing protein [Phycisphaerales bacterium AB-hyl4]|uniref:Helix-turn-helix domain-containing protein n=1 Tax=Natronomicrosphaera hydrolytica TaxID=3242702 RepID=A0ABV4U4V1_9BACT